MNKKLIMILFISLTILICTAVSAENLTTTDSGVVNGGVYSHAVQKTPYNQQVSGGNTEQVSFNITDNIESNHGLQSTNNQLKQDNNIQESESTNDYKSEINSAKNLKQDTATITDIQTGRLYTMVYVQSTNDRYGAIVNVTLDGNNDGVYETILENNTELRIASSTNGTVYTINENITRVYSDYLLSYNITNYIQANTVNVKVETYSGPELGYADAKIKCIGLAAAYNVSSSDKEYNYWFNTGHSWTNDITTTTFATRGITAEDASLTQVATSSSKADTYFNGKKLDVKEPSNYFSENVWNVTDLYDNSTDSLLENEPTGGLYGATYKTIMASLVITNNIVAPTAEVSVDRFGVSSNSGDALVYVDNTLQATLSNTGATLDNAKLTLNINDYSQTVDITDLGARAQRFNFDYVTQEKGSKDVSIVIDYLNGTTETLYTGELIVKYNGYMGKSFTEGENFTTKRVYEGFNTLNIIPVHEYQSASWQNFTSSINATEFGLTDENKVVDVLYYQNYNWDYGYVLDTYQLQVNNQIIKSIANYNDTKGFGSQWDFPSGVLVYNITSIFKVNDTNIFNITRNTEDNLALYTGYIVAIYANATNPTIIKINEETDLLNTESSGYGTNSSTAISYSIYDDIDTNDLSSASLCVVSGAANFPDSKIFFNDKEYGSMNDGFNYTQQQSFSTYDVDNIIDGTNLVTLQSINDNLVVLGTILTLNYYEPLVNIDNLTIASNSNNFLVNQENDIKITLSCEKQHSPINVTLKIDDEEMTQNIENVDTSDSVDFIYVPTTDGVKNIEVIIEYLNGTTTTYNTVLTAYYNGYMGKSFTNGENFTTKRQYSGKNTLVLNPFEFYQSTRWTEFTQEYDAAANGIVNQDKVVEVLYYQGYNWNTNLNINVKINDVDADMIAGYNDSKGFASYNYPSGVLVYNVTTGFNANENNILTITPIDANSNSLYGGYLVIIYANNTYETDIIINEGADLLNPESSGYGANTTNTIAYSNYNDITSDKAVLYTITAAADKVGDSKIIVNDKVYGSLADNYDSTSRLSIVESNIDNLADGENIVALQSTNDNLFTMGTILVVNQNIPELIVESVKATVGQSITLTATITSTDIEINSGKVVFKVNGKTVKDENGKIIYAKVNGNVATIEYTPNTVQNITYTAVYTGSSVLGVLNSQKANLTVEPEEITLSVDDVSGKIGDKVSLSARLSSDTASGKLVFKVNGKTVKDENGKIIYANIVDGVATIEYDLSNLKARDYTLTCVFMNSKSERIEQNATLTVSKA